VSEVGTVGREETPGSTLRGEEGGTGSLAARRRTGGLTCRTAWFGSVTASLKGIFSTKRSQNKKRPRHLLLGKKKKNL